MQTLKQLFKQLLNDIKVDLDDEFDRNFERKAFFNTAWKPAKFETTGSLMVRTGALRKSLRSETVGSRAIRWKSDKPYAEIHNSGGTIVVTPKMKGFFWYRYKLATGSMEMTKKGELRKNNVNRKLTAESEFYKAMALKKVGSKIDIPQRQFIGDHPVVDRCVKKVADDWFINDVKQFIDNRFK